MARQLSNPNTARFRASIAALSTQFPAPESVPRWPGDLRTPVTDNATNCVETIKPRKEDDDDNLQAPRTQPNSLAATLRPEILIPVRGEIPEYMSMTFQESRGPSLSNADARNLGAWTLGGLETLPDDRVLRLDIGFDILAIVGPSSLIDREVFHELANLEYIRSRILCFPSPVCLGGVKFNGCTYLWLKPPQGQSLDTIWPSLTTEMKLSVRNELETIFRTLRTVQRTNQDRRFGNCALDICKDGLHFNHKSGSFIVSETDFNNFLFSHSGCTLTPEMHNLRNTMARNHELKLSHGNLHPGNIMVTVEKAEDDSIKDVRVSGITGWEHAGWYPAYWEFVQTMHAADREGPLADWGAYVPYDAIGDYTKEYWKDVARIKGLRSQGH